MKDTINIKANNLEDRSTLLGVLYAVGAVFHLKTEPGYYDLEKAKAAHTNHLNLSIARIANGLDISGRGDTPDVNWSENPAKTLALIMEFVKAKPEGITVEDVGDYEAVVKKDGIHIYGQVIPFDKFDEIAAAVNNLNK